MIERELIYSTLWTKVSTEVVTMPLATPFVTIQRRLRHYADVTPAEQPSLFMAETGGYAGHLAGTRVDYQTNAPVVWTLVADFYIYVYVTDVTVAPGQIINPLIDAVELALQPKFADNGFQTLGLNRQVRHARLQGKLQTDEGVLGNQALAIIPVEIFCI